MVVRFTEPDEFLADLERDPHAVVRKLVRLTKAGRPTIGGAATAVSVLATAKVASGAGDFDLVRLDVYIGELWGAGQLDDDVQRRANELVRNLEERLVDRGFVLGAGFYDSADGL